MERAATEKNQHLLSTLGLCKRAGGLVIGTPMVCEAMKDKKKGVLAVLEAENTSDNTHDKLTSKCAYYSVPHYRIPVTTEALGHTVGKTGAVAAVGVTHAGLFRALQKHLPEASITAPAEPNS